ncbi:MAG: hypothetical protein NT077_00515 [Candidatus Taylorbacteria bacterium]|nr:hypothetical protein [Candidatus Taylorbacteria bacterium]
MKEQYGLLLGVMLGVVGGLLAPIVDRYFSKFGMLYEVPVALLFFGTMWFIERHISKGRGNS